jgi:hypothetical protein
MTGGVVLMWLVYLVGIKRMCLGTLWGGRCPLEVAENATLRERTAIGQHKRVYRY